MKEIRIRDKYFKQHLQIFYDCDIEEFYERTDNMDIYDWEKEWVFIWSLTSNLIWVKNIRDTWCLVHELSHFLFYNFEKKNINPLDNMWEIFCYWIEYYLKEILKKLKYPGTTKPILLDL